MAKPVKPEPTPATFPVCPPGGGSYTRDAATGALIPDGTPPASTPNDTEPTA